MENLMGDGRSETEKKIKKKIQSYSNLVYLFDYYSKNVNIQWYRWIDASRFVA